MDEEREKLTGFLANVLKEHGIEYADQIDACEHEKRGICITVEPAHRQSAELLDSQSLAAGVDWRDWKAARQHAWNTWDSARGPAIAGKETVKAILLCADFSYRYLPSVTETKEAREAKREAEAEARHETAGTRLEELHAANEAAYKCEGCDGVFGEDELIQVRECPMETCDTEYFNGTDNGRNCEGCNRPFTRIVHDHGCPECDPSEEECEEMPTTLMETFGS